MERVSLFSIDRKEELASFSIKRRECLFYPQRRKTLLALYRGGMGLHAIYTNGRLSSLDREALSPNQHDKGRWCLSIEEGRAIFSVQRRDSLFVVDKALLSLYRDTLSLPFYVKGR